MLFIIIDLFNFDSIIHVRNTLDIQRGENHITQFPPFERALDVQDKKVKYKKKKNATITTMAATKLNHRIMLLEYFRSTKFVYF